MGGWVTIYLDVGLLELLVLEQAFPKARVVVLLLQEDLDGAGEDLGGWVGGWVGG